MQTTIDRGLRIAITGIGIVSALGCDQDSALQALRDHVPGRGGAADLPSAPTAARVRDFEPGRYMPKKKVRRMDAVNCYVIASARMALEQAGLDATARRGCGIVVGTGFAGLDSVVKHQKRFTEEGITQLSPIHFPTTVYNASAGLAAIELGLSGPNATVTGVDLPAEHALLYAALLLRGGMAEQLLVVGADELVEALAMGYADLGLLAEDDGNGLVLGEGAAALLLEPAAAAAARGADVIGFIDGIGSAAAPGARLELAAEAAELVIDQALGAATLGRQDIGWLSLGGNGSPRLDAAEAAACGRFAATQPTTVTLKHYTGEFAGSGALRLALGLLCGRAGFLPGPEGPQQTTPERSFLHLGLGVGGNAAAVVASPNAGVC